MTILAIDPGCTESGYALIDLDTRRPLEVGKIPNEDLLRDLGAWMFDWRPASQSSITHISIEMVASYGMAVGKEVFETCVWIGRFQECASSCFTADYRVGVPVDLVYRRDVKLHLCGTSKAKDANISQALIDRFASGQPNRGKGTKAAPGWFHGFRADIWAAYALAITVADRLEGRPGVSS